MKIRITGKGLKKAQMWNSQVDNSNAWDKNTTFFDKWKTPEEVATSKAQVPMAPAAIEYNQSSSPTYSGNGMSMFNTLELGTGLANTFYQPQQQKAWDSKFRQNILTDNSQPIVQENTSGNRGDYDVNNGMFRPNEIGFKSKGMYTNKMYSSQPIAQYGGALDELLGMASNMPIPSLIGQMAPSFPTSVAAASSPSQPEISSPSDGKKGSISVRNNNPGNMEYSSFTKKYGATPGTIRPDGIKGNYAYFSSLEDGLNAQKALITNGGYKNLDVDHAINRWITGNPNKPGAYTANTIDPSLAHKKVGELSSEELSKLQKGIIKNEDGTLYKILKQKGVFDTGGQTGGNMKIKITGGPGATMAYGGQKGYGFDLGQSNTYAKMNQSGFSDASNKIQEVPRDEANIEAEKGETVYGDLDNDGMMEHKEIEGKRHYAGGTPLDVPEGSFIFSDTKKMKIKDPEILKQFGKGAKPGGITPADIAKQYDITKFKAILQDPLSDPLAKKTAEMMLTNFNKKLSALADVQESMKGYPQGKPQVAQQSNGQQVKAQYGGLQRFQTAGTVGTYQPGVNKDLDERTAAGFTIVKPGTFMADMPGLQHQQGNSGVYGTENFTDLNHFMDFQQRFPEFFASHKDWDPRQKGQTQQFQQWYTDNVDKDYFSGTPGKDPYSIDDKFGQHTWSAPMWNKSRRPVFPEHNDPEVTIPAEHSMSMTIPEKVKTNGIPKKSSYRTDGAPWWQQDKNNVYNATMNWADNKKYLPFIPDVSLQHASPTFEDWRGTASALTAGYNNNAAVQGIYGPSSALATNLSALAGQQAEHLANAISGTGQRNVGVANQFAQQDAQITNNETAQRAQNRRDLWNGNVIANQQYDNANKEGRAGFVNAYNNGLTNAANTYNMNTTQPYFGVDPRSGGKMYWKGPGASAMFFNQKTNPSASDYEDLINKSHDVYAASYAKNAKYSEKERHAIAMADRDAFIRLHTETSRANTGAYGQPKGYTDVRRGLD